MSTLYLLRHANAGRAEPGTRDKDRELSKKGLQTCASLSAKLSEDEIRPELILCSTAVRARQTLNAISHIWPSLPETRYIDYIYEADSEGLRKAIKKHTARHKEIMIIGHNPVLQELSLHLSNTPGSRPHRQALSNFSPGTMAKLYGDERSWPEVTIGKFNFLKLYRP